MSSPLTIGVAVAISVAVSVAIVLPMVLSNLAEDQEKARERRMAEHKMNARLLRFNI